MSRELQPISLVLLECNAYSVCTPRVQIKIRSNIGVQPSPYSCFIPAILATYTPCPSAYVYLMLYYRFSIGYSSPCRTDTLSHGSLPLACQRYRYSRYGPLTWDGSQGPPGSKIMEVSKY